LNVATALNYPLVKLFNRVLSDYPMAREQLAAHAGKVVAASVGPIDSRVRVTADGATEMIGEGADIQPDVSFQIPLSLLPRLARKEEAAFREVVFTGDSEFAALLARLAREVEWDIEEDLSKWIGDIAAHRVVDTVKRTHEWRVDATERLTENVAEYLTEEKRAFMTKHDLETLARANETLRDDVARLEARVANLVANVTAS
jgi:ubiquinone biosynthesis protein UbiJ